MIHQVVQKLLKAVLVTVVNVVVDILMSAMCVNQVSFIALILQKPNQATVDIN